MGSACNSVKKEQSPDSKQMFFMDRLILCKIHHNQEIYKINFSTKSTIKEIKQNIFLYYLKNITPENNLIRLYYNSKELKPDNYMLKNFVSDMINEIDISMVSLTLTEDMKKDDIKIDEAIIKNFSINCVIHQNEKCIMICLTCSHCICDKCKANDHQNHETLNKFDILKMEESFKQNYFDLNEKFKNLGINGDYYQFYDDFKSKMKKQSDDLSTKVDAIKKKEKKLFSSFKLSFDQIFPSLLDYKDKVEGINLTFDNKKETILKNDRDIIDFYQRINNVNSLKEVTNEQLISLKEKLDKYTEIFQEFKNKTENILNYMNDQYDKLKQLEISHDNMTITSNNPKKTQDNLSGIFESPIKTYLTKYQSGQNPAAFKQNFNSEQLSKRKKLNNSPNKLSSSIKSLVDINRKVANESLESKLIESNKISSEQDRNVKPNSTNNEDALEQKSNLAQKSINEKNFDSKNGFSQDNPDFSLSIKFDDSNHIYKKIASIETTTKNLFIFDSILNKITKIALDLKGCEIKTLETYHSSVNYNEMFYISGGMHQNSKLFFKYDLNLEKLSKMTDMINGHSYHTMSCKKSFIYAISGFNTKKCERYSIDSNSWSSLPDLNFSRSLPSCSFYFELLYVFAGYDDKTKKCVNSIERIDTSKSKFPVWEHLDIKVDEKFPYYSGIILENEKLLIFGGKILMEPVNNIWTYNLKEKKLEKNDGLLLNNDEFNGKNFLLIGENKYGQFSSIFQNCFVIYENNKFSKESY